MGGKVACQNWAFFQCTLTLPLLGVSLDACPGKVWVAEMIDSYEPRCREFTAGGLASGGDAEAAARAHFAEKWSSPRILFQLSNEGLQTSAVVQLTEIQSDGINTFALDAIRAAAVTKHLGNDDTAHVNAVATGLLSGDGSGLSTLMGAMSLGELTSGLSDGLSDGIGGLAGGLGEGVDQGIIGGLGGLAYALTPNGVPSFLKNDGGDEDEGAGAKGP